MKKNKDFTYYGRKRLRVQRAIEVLKVLLNYYNWNN